jgi:hypothetical protein
MNALDHPVELPESIHLAPGQVTIECRSMEHLRDQLMLLTEAIDVNHEALRATVETAPRRRAASEGPSPGAKARSAWCFLAARVHLWIHTDACVLLLWQSALGEIARSTLSQAVSMTKANYAEGTSLALCIDAIS